MELAAVSARPRLGRDESPRMRSAPVLALACAMGLGATVGACAAGLPIERATLPVLAQAWVLSLWGLRFSVVLWRIDNLLGVVEWLIGLS